MGIIMFQCRFINCNKGTTLVEMLLVGGRLGLCEDRRSMGNLHFALNFTENLKLL